MGRIYTARFKARPIAGARDFIALLSAFNVKCFVHEYGFSNEDVTGDSTEQHLVLIEKTGPTTLGTGGITPTIVPLLFGDPASGSTVKADTLATSGGATNLFRSPVWNTRFAYRRVFSPADVVGLAPSDMFVVRSPVGPTTSFDLSGYSDSYPKQYRVMTPLCIQSC